jgi:cell shape-determining protein MreD
MLAALLAFPILTALLVLQMAIFSQVPLLQGTPDLVLLALLAWTMQKRGRAVWPWALVGGGLMTYASALPTGAYLVAYGAAVALAVLLKQRVWRAQMLAMLIATFFGGFLVHLVLIIALKANGSPFPFWQAINLVTLPSVLLNLGLAVPFYILLGDLAGYLYPEELEV